MKLCTLSLKAPGQLESSDDLPLLIQPPLARESGAEEILAGGRMVR